MAHNAAREVLTLDTAEDWATALGWEGAFTSRYNHQQGELPITDQEGDVHFSTKSGTGTLVYSSPIPGLSGIRGVHVPAGASASLTTAADKGWQVGADEPVGLVVVLALADACSTTGGLLRSGGPGSNRFYQQLQGASMAMAHNVTTATLTTDLGSGSSLPVGVYLSCLQRRADNSVHAALYGPGGLTATATGSSDGRAYDALQPSILNLGVSTLPAWWMGPFGVAIGTQPNLGLSHLESLASYLGLAA